MRCMRLPILQAILLLALVAMAGFALLGMKETRISSVDGALASPVEGEVLYLPSGKALHFVSFGYTNALSQVLWLNTISYFGKHFRLDQNYRWLAHMCTIVSDLNPQAEQVYHFCSAMLAWEANSPRESVAILSHGISVRPQDWYLYYLRGFVYMFFLHDAERARDDFVAAAKLPGVELFVVRLAAKKLAELESPQTAIEFLEEAMVRTKDPLARQALSNKLQRILKEKR